MNQQKTYLPISKLHLWDKNPRNISKDAYESLKNKIKRWDQFKPVICTPEGEVIGGNMRLRAYQELGIADIWVSIVEPKDEAEKLEIAIADNEASGRWQEEALAEYLYQYKDQIKLSDYQLDLGKPTSLDDLLSKYSPEPVEDEVPEVEDEAISQLGEVYQLGRHRVMCGDSTKIEDVEKLMDGKKADMVFTDPPYGVEYTGGQFYSGKPIKDRREQIKNDDILLYQQGLSNASLFIDNGAIYVCYASSFTEEVLSQLNDAGLERRAILIWNKTNTGYGDLNSHYKNNYEPIFYGVKKGHNANWCGDTTQTTVWSIDKPKENVEHPTMKPIELCAKAITNSSKLNGLVIDLFLGSGSTLIACEQTNRTCYGMELDPRYVDVIRKRYAKFIGKEEEWEEITPKI